MNQDRTNISVTGMIILMVLFPMAILLVGRFVNHDNDPPEAIFDTLTVPGYTFFRNHGIQIGENSDTALYNAVFPLMGIPHRSRAGRNGLDCSGFVKKVFHVAYEKQLRGSSRDMYRNATPIPLDELRESDLIFFTIGSSQINHVGIYLNNGKFAHASSSAGVSVNDLQENYYRRHFKGAARITLP